MEATTARISDHPDLVSKPPSISCCNQSSRPIRGQSYGYRPARGAVDAVKDVHRLICRGYTDVVDADLSKYFDTIPHAELMRCVARRIVDRHVLHLIKMWLGAPIEERDGDGKRRIVGGKGNRRGTPQGGVASPLLANIYMNRFLKHWRLTECGEAFRAHVVAYADDFVILSRGRAAEALAWTKAVMTRLGLTINEAKTSLRDARQERFSFFATGSYLMLQIERQELSERIPSRSMQRLRPKFANLLVRQQPPWPTARHAEQILAAGRTTSASGRVGRHSAVSIATSMSACATSSPDGTRWQGAGPNGSPATWSMENAACCASNACRSLPRRVPHDEASRRAGCRRSARPVR